MEEIKFYRVTLTSDQGRHHLWTAAMNEEAVRQLICACQGCPPSAILKVVEKTKRQFQNKFKS
jgi:Fe-S cluster biogenesis protein NfuA